MIAGAVQKAKSHLSKYVKIKTEVFAAKKNLAVNS